MKITLSILKADVGSIGGHTKPSDRMMEAVRSDAAAAVERGLLIDAFVGHTGDDICIVASHTRGENDTEVHQFAWSAFLNATAIASRNTGCMARVRICWWTRPRAISGAPARR